MNPQTSNEQQAAVATIKSWRANPALRPSHGLRNDNRISSGTRSIPSPDKSVNPALEVAIQRKWDADAAIRAEFGELSTYAAYVRGTASERLQIVGAVSVVSTMPAAAPAVTSNISPAEVAAGIQSAVSNGPVPLDRYSAKHWPMDLVEKVNRHQALLMGGGMGYGDAWDKAKTLVVTENPARFL